MDITLKKWQMLILTSMILISFSVTVILLADFDKPTHYNLLFLLPLIFALYLLVYAKVMKNFLGNIGITMILGLMFVRLVISPFFMLLGGYNDKITLNVHFNTSISIILVAYETIAIMTALFLLVKKSPDKFIVVTTWLEHQSVIEPLKIICDEFNLKFNFVSFNLS